MSIVLESVDLSFSYRKETPILKEINFSIERGEVVAIMGLSGCGKSTLCYCLSGVIPHLYGGIMTGKVLLQGSPIESLTLPQISTRLGVVFQNPETQLFFSTVEDEVAFGPENLGLAKKEIGRRIEESLKVLGILDLRYANSQKLSGGQKQLVALASVLSLEPEILIFDEISSQVDDKGRSLIQQTIRRLKKLGKTIIMNEHNPNNLHCADRVVLLKQGRLEPFVGSL